MNVCHTVTGEENKGRGFRLQVGWVCEGRVVGLVSQKKELEDPPVYPRWEVRQRWAGGGGDTTCSGTMLDVLCRKCWHFDL